MKKEIMFYLKLVVSWVLVAIGAIDIYISVIGMFPNASPLLFLSGLACLFAASVILKESVYG